MLSVQHCREILGSNCRLADHELELFRDQMYRLADIVVAQIKDSIPKRVENRYPVPHEMEPDGFDAASVLLTSEEREDVEERAAIIEFEAGADRDEAERKAVLIAIKNNHETK